jgi:hypothetical protein
VKSEKAERSRIMVQLKPPAFSPQAVDPKIRQVPSLGAGSSRRRSISHQEIQDRAYQKWEAMGMPVGKDLKFWLEAQRELSEGK